jgi:stage II sporulation protein AA (anti-sigma F factor antagonist)
LTAAVAGELDHHGAKTVMAELDRQIDRALPRELTLDLRELTFTDSSGIAVLLRAYRRMGQTRGTLRVVNTPAQADRVFRAAGLDRLIRFE